jgi:integrase
MSPATAKTYANTVGKMLDEGPTPEEWLAGAITRDTATRTATVYRAAVGAYYRWQKSQTAGTVIERDSEEVRAYARGLKGLRGTRRGMDRTAPTMAQYRAFTEAAAALPRSIRTLLLLLPHTGLRVSEACALTRDDLVREGLRTKLLVRSGKGNKQRIVPMNPSTVRLLNDYLAAEPPRKTGHLFWREPSAYILEPRPIRTYEVEIALQKLREQDDRLAGLTPHSFRHLYATTAVRQGVPLTAVQAYLGHESRETTLRYTHADASMLEEAADTVGAALDAALSKSP